MSDTLFDALQGVVGASHIRAGSEDSPELTDRHRRYRGRALAIVRPASTEEVARVVRLCAAARAPIVVQGGNTGLMGGATPDASGTAVLLRLDRLNRVREVDTANDTLTVEAGCILQQVQVVAREAGRLFPLSLGAEGSCTLGGNLGTNAGGHAVLRYGNARELTLGLEVVTADGEVWDGLRGLRKDNTGYDLKQIFLGAEGTLGIITAAVLKLYPLPKASATAFIAVPSPQAAVTLLNAFRARCGDRLTGFEIMSRRCLDLLFKHMPQFSDPLAGRHPWYVLGEINDTLEATDLRGAMEATLAAGMETGLVLDAVVASSQAQATTLWRMREEIPEANRREGPWVRHDVSVPVSRIPELIEHGSAALEVRFPGVRIAAFGHIGDGNIHFNATAAEGVPAEPFVARQHEVYAIVHELVMSLGGSFSAEHGIGQVKVHEMAQYKSALELDLMQRLKHSFDPQGILNPGKVLPAQ